MRRLGRRFAKLTHFLFVFLARSSAPARSPSLNGIGLSCLLFVRPPYVSVTAHVCLWSPRRRDDQFAYEARRSAANAGSHSALRMVRRCRWNRRANSLTPHPPKY